jgi:hypothetical protein
MSKTSGKLDVARVSETRSVRTGQSGCVHHSRHAPEMCKSRGEGGRMGGRLTSQSVHFADLDPARLSIEKS